MTVFFFIFSSQSVSASSSLSDKSRLELAAILASVGLRHFSDRFCHLINTCAQDPDGPTAQELSSLAEQGSEASAVQSSAVQSSAEVEISEEEDDDSQISDTSTFSSVTSSSANSSPVQDAGKRRRTNHITPNGHRYISATSGDGPVLTTTPFTTRTKKGRHQVYIMSQTERDFERIDIENEIQSEEQIIQHMLNVAEIIINQMNLLNVDCSGLDQPLYVGRTKNVEQRSKRHASDIDSSKHSRKSQGFRELRAETGRPIVQQSFVYNIHETQVALFEGLITLITGACHNRNGLNSQAPSTGAQEFFDEYLSDQVEDLKDRRRRLVGSLSGEFLKAKGKCEGKKPAQEKKRNYDDDEDDDITDRYLQGRLSFESFQRMKA